MKDKHNYQELTRRVRELEQIHQDFSTQRNRESHLKNVLLAIRDVNKLIARETDPEQLIQKICTSLVQTRGYFSAWIALTDEKGEVAEASAAAGFNGSFGFMESALHRGEFPFCMRHSLGMNKVAVTRNPPADCPDCPLSSEYEGRSGLACRLSHKDRVFGILSISVPEKFAHDNEEQDLFAELAADLGHALGKLKTDIQVQRLTQIVKSILQPISLVSRDYRYLAVNDVYAELFETALLKSEARYRNVTEANAGLVWEMDANLTVTHYSGRVYEILGYAPEEIIGRNPLFLIDPKDRERISAIMTRMVQTQEPVKDIESWCRHSDGRRVRILTNGIAFFSQDGNLLGFRGTQIDITEIFWARRCQEIVLQLHSMINDSDDAISAFLCKACSEVTDSSMAFFGMLEPDESAMMAHVWSPEAMEECRIADKPLRFPIETAGLWAQPILMRKPVIVNEYQRALEKQGLPEGHVPIIRYLGVPILHGDSVVAVVGAANKSSDYAERHINRLQVITSSIADILLLRRKEEALRESEEKHRRLFETMAQGVIYQATDGTIISANPAAERILGLSFEQMQEMTSMDPHWKMINEDGTEIPGTDHPAMIALRTGETFGPVIRGVLHPDKHSHVWLSITAIPLFQPGETKPSQVYATFEDISERKKDILALQENRQLLQSMMEAIPDLVSVHDKDMTILYSNWNGFGAVPKEKRVIGTKCYHTYRGFNEICPDCQAKAVFQTKRNFQMETRLMQAQKLESIGSLAGGIAHDFNNLLFPIVGISEMMLDDFAPGSPEHHDVQEIYKAGNRGRELVQQILSFSRQSEHHLIPVHIQKILKEVCKLSRATIPADIPITRDIQPDCRPVMADPTQIHQIAMNLITNAYHAVEPDGGTITIALTEMDVDHGGDPVGDLAPGRYAMLSISDTGTGIDPVIINKIFDPYFTTKEKGKGTGLGLATVYGIVKSYGGEIRVDSDIGKGACFQIYLPVLEKTADDIPEKQQQILPTGTEHLLLVDDEVSIVHLERQMLKRLGYRITSFTGSVDALAAFETDPAQFDMVITDMNMPHLNGLQLAKKLIAVRADIPVIICTGFSERIDEGNTEAMGIKGLLMKPVGMMDLAHKVREVIDRG
jgi:PAS domain S-box-containing protein